MEIQYVEGDATRPIGDDPAAILHICNDVGAWGAGFVLALNKRFGSGPMAYYQMWHRYDPWSFKLGNIQPVLIASDPLLLVVNMIAQHRTGIAPDGSIPLRYSALLQTLEKTVDWIVRNGLVLGVHMPRIGCGLAGGDWNVVSQLVEDAFFRYPGRRWERDPIPVTVYDYVPAVES